MRGALPGPTGPNCPICGRPLRLSGEDINLGLEVAPASDDDDGDDAQDCCLLLEGQRLIIEVRPAPPKPKRLRKILWSCVSALVSATLVAVVIKQDWYAALLKWVRDCLAKFGIH